MYNKIKDFKWDNERKKKYQIITSKIYGNYEVAEKDTFKLGEVVKKIENLLEKNEKLNFEDEFKYILALLEKYENIKEKINKFMYFTYILNLDQKDKVIKNNNNLYKRLYEIEKYKKVIDKKIYDLMNDRNINKKMLNCILNNFILKEIIFNNYNINDDFLKGDLRKEYIQYKNRKEYLKILKDENKRTKKLKESLFEIRKKEESKENKLKVIYLLIKIYFEFFKTREKLKEKNIDLEYDEFYMEYNFISNIIDKIDKFFDSYDDLKNILDFFNKQNKKVPRKISTIKLFSFVNKGMKSFFPNDQSIEEMLNLNKIDYFSRENKTNINFANYGNINLNGKLLEKDIFIIAHEYSHILEYNLKKMKYKKYTENFNIDRSGEIFARVNEFLMYRYIKENNFNIEKFFSKNELLNYFKNKKLYDLYIQILNIKVVSLCFKYFEKRKKINVDLKKYELEEILRKIIEKMIDKENDKNKERILDKKELINILYNEFNIYNPYLQYIYVIGTIFGNEISNNIANGKLSIEEYKKVLGNADFLIKDKNRRVEKLNVNFNNSQKMEKYIKRFFDEMKKNRKSNKKIKST